MGVGVVCVCVCLCVCLCLCWGRGLGRLSSWLPFAAPKTAHVVTQIQG